METQYSECGIYKFVGGSLYEHAGDYWEHVWMGPVSTLAEALAEYEANNAA